MRDVIGRLIGRRLHRSALSLSIGRFLGWMRTQPGGFIDAMDEKALPQSHRGTETGPENALLAVFSVPRCLCGKAYLFCTHRHNLVAPLSLFRHGCLAVAFLALLNLPAIAVEPGEQLKNPALEARAREISSGLRCLVCQNETIDESSASLAHDIRILLRERLTDGDTDEQAVKAIVDRYGDFVLLDPPVKPATYMLWFGPPAVLLAGLLGGMVWLRRRSDTAETTTPLTTDERRRLDTILREVDR
jgi:cytochrome c-type biogenesis protein CcmH